MKKVLFAGAAMLLVASAAFGAGIDLSIGACPGAGGVGEEGGDPGCGGEPTVSVLATFAPAEAITDLVGIDALLEIQALPDLDAANFWNVSAGGCGLGLAGDNFLASNVRPTGCANHTNTWAGGIGGASALRRGPAIERIAFACARATALNVIANQRLFGAQLVFNGNGESETNGCVGCSAPVTMVWNSGKPASQGASTPSELNNASGAFPAVTNCMGFNGGGPNCAAVPARKATWGQLKSLYR